MTLEQFKKKMKRMPDTPGVYFFLGKNKRILYIGKATNLRDRIRSYFAPDLHKARSLLVANMVAEAVSVDWRKTDSVLEALLLEASLIKTYKPKANTDLKDDKSFNYVVITKEDFPRILVVRGKELQMLRKSKPAGVHDFFAKKSLSPRAVALRSLPPTSFTSTHTFGPFPHGKQLQDAIKLIRKIFPFRDKCIPGQGRPCFNAQIGLCPGVCLPAQAGNGDLPAGKAGVTKQDYRRTIRHIVLLFEGKKKQLVKALNKEMRAAAAEENFELAKELQRQMYALQHIQDVSLIKDEYRSPSTTLGAIRSTRIEAYDIAHLRGSAAVGVMVVVEDGAAEKSQYRKFKIKSLPAGRQAQKGINDPVALREILSRRLGHDEWPLPRLLVVDGSTAQINAARSVLAEYGMAIPVVGVVKDEKHHPRNILGDRELIKDHERDLLLANAEAHRFAVGYHRKTSRRNLV